MTSAKLRPTSIQLSALVTDPIDGTIRLLGDVQRFGLRLVRADVQEHAGGSLVTLVLASTDAVDGLNLEARFARHPCVAWATVDDAARVLPRAA